MTPTPAVGPEVERGESVIQRVARVLNAFGGEAAGLSIAEISRRSDLPETTARRIVQALIDEGILQRGTGRRVVIGNRMWEQINRASPTLRLRDAALGYLEDIQAVVGHHVALSVLDGDEVLYIERLSARTQTVSMAVLAARLPWHEVSAGLVLVGSDDPDEQDRRLRRKLIKHTPATVVDPHALREMLESTRRNGYAVCAAMNVPSSSGISVPILDARRRVVAALTVIVPVGDERVARTLPLLQAASRGISRALGLNNLGDSADLYRKSYGAPE